jgi:hypothetical protein
MPRFSTICRSFALLILSALTLTVVSGCDDTALPRPEPNGRISIQLKDAPGDIKHAVVTIDEVYMQGGPVGRVVLSNTPFTVDLTTLKDRPTPLIGDVVVPNARYIQLRFVISGAYVEVENEDGSTSIFASSSDYAGLPPGATVDGDLQISGAAKVGSEVALPNNGILIRGNDRSLLVDFDVERSFSANGLNSWRLSPVLSASDLETISSAIVTVSLDPTVTLPIVDGRQLTLADFSAVISTAVGFKQQKQLTDPDGDDTFSAEFRFLNAATYSVTLVGPEGIVLTTTPLLPAQLVINAQETKTLAIRVLDISGLSTDPIE